MTAPSISSPRTALYVTLGCKLNFAETSAVATELARRGIRRIRPGETPDLCVVNTCSVTSEADKKCRRTIRSLASHYPSATIIVTGCYAQLNPTEAASIPGVAIVAGINDKLRIGELLDSWERDRKQISAVPPAKDLREFMPSCSRGDRTRYFLKVQDGCNYWCTYCTIPAARGRSRSGLIPDIVAQAEAVVREGGREIVITGVNIGDFGHGRTDTLLDLIRRLDNVEGIDRYRISSIEPNLLTEEIIDFVASSRRFMPHFHVPLQSGSDEVLRLMHRHYDTALFASRMAAIRKRLPDAFIGVDLIAGPRGETPALFDESLRFIESLPISRLHVFTYSERPGTKALEIPYAVSQEDKHARTRRMLALSSEKLRQFSEAYVGTVRPVLVEHITRGHMGGFTDNYLRVELQPQPELANRVVNVRLTRPSDDFTSFRGEIVG